ncbi:protein adenylyltransferase SelO [Caldimonas brevitalea]|uniref:Protein nucleotidyltransferase YdiU n=1 Tax=Caldimonas brevitalea TaxID=413882 RepID=A0A0G3BEP1_9BURK|nr:YdiU family protein [Caldimonas brevitalea]AKJ27879.1 Selenoprotein O and cysteine-containing protein [Caldimonas brevitalea]
MSAPPAFPFDNTYARDLPGFYVRCQPATVASPRLLFFNRELAQELKLDCAALDGPQGAGVFAGNTVPEGADPLAQAYAGHQFGGFSPQLGDGRALLLGEVIDRRGQRRDIALKGSGRTPFSRGGDGKAAVGPMLREVLIGEAMHALGIPTTRALAVAATGETVERELPLPGAVLTRVAASHLRVGTFEFFAARDDLERLRQLADYTIARHDPDLVGTPDRYVALLRRVAERQAALVAQWMNIGFIHGVMNTDNMTISGETIDYGPCAFIEAYDPQAVFSSIDHGGRYAYGNQPLIARWNLARLGEALLPLIAEDMTEAGIEKALGQATEVIDAFPDWYARALLAGQRAKLGLQRATADDDPADTALAEDWLALLHAQAVDFTLGWRRLADAAEGDEAALRGLFQAPQALEPWLGRWRERCASEDAAAPDGTGRAARMRRVNPWVIPRNHRVEEALAAATHDDDLGPFQQLLAALRRPYEETPENTPYAEPAPSDVTACYQTFCGT